MKKIDLRQKIIIYVSLILLVSFVGFPLLQMISMAFKGPGEQFAIPVTILPQQWTLENFIAALNHAYFGIYFRNSLLVAIATTMLTLVIATFGAYGFTRTDFPGRRFFLSLLLFGQMICLAAIAIPIFRIIGRMGFTNSFIGLVICYLTFSIPVAIWLLRGFILGIPKELEEAAIVDGASRLVAFIKVVVPLLRPGMGAAGAYVYFLSWQEFLFSMIVMTDRNRRTLPTGIMDYVGMFETNWGSLMASSILLSLPVFVIFIFIQRQLISGLTEGAVKG